MGASLLFMHMVRSSCAGSSALYQIGAMFGIGAAGVYDPYSVFVLQEYGIYFLLAALFSTPLPGILAGRLPKNTLYNITKAVLYMGLLILCLSFLLMGAHNPFIYFNF